MKTYASHIQWAFYELLWQQWGVLWSQENQRKRHCRIGRITLKEQAR